jgi:hypothetical protein
MPEAENAGRAVDIVGRQSKRFGDAPALPEQDGQQSFFKPQCRDQQSLGVVAWQTGGQLLLGILDPQPFAQPVVGGVVKDGGGWNECLPVFFSLVAAA